MVDGTTEAAGPATKSMNGRNYVVVSADAHAAPDNLDQFLSYVDPADREAVAAFGDLSVGGHPHVRRRRPRRGRRSDAVRAVATRRLAGMGVDTEAARTGWPTTARTGSFASDADGRRLAVLEEQGIHAEVVFPGPVLAGGLPRPCISGSQRGSRAGVARPPRLRPLAGRLLRCRPGPPDRVHPDRPPRHGPGRRGDRLGPRHTGSPVA